MAEKIYKCNSLNCNRKFNEEEYQLTNDKSKCIFHCEKEQWHKLKKDKKIWENHRIQYFWQELNKLLLEGKEYSFEKSGLLGTGSIGIRNYVSIKNSIIPPLGTIKNLSENILYYTFMNCTFVDDFSVDLGFNEEINNGFDFLDCKFNGLCNFSATDNGKINSEIYFSGTIHDDDIYIGIDECKNILMHSLNRKNKGASKYITINIAPKLLIRRLKFNNIVVKDLDDSLIEKIKIYEVEIENLMISQHFKTNNLFDLYINNVIISSSMNIYNILFNDLVLNSVFPKNNPNMYLQHLEINNFKIINSNLRKVNVSEIKTIKELILIDTELDYSNINDSNFELANKKIEKCTFINTIMNNLKWGNQNDIITSRDIFRQLKFTNEWQGNIIEANKFYALEMKEREKELEADLKKGKNFFEWLVFKIHGISSNHSQDWLLALFWIINFTFALGTIKCSINLFGLNFISFIPFIFIIIISLRLSTLENIFKNGFLVFFSLISYGLYSLITSDFQLHKVVNHINPFSVMNSWDNLTFGEFIYKIIIAYLIYQLIISIRQNTRRK